MIGANAYARSKYSWSLRHIRTVVKRVTRVIRTGHCAAWERSRERIPLEFGPSLARCPLVVIEGAGSCTNRRNIPRVPQWGMGILPVLPATPGYLWFRALWYGFHCCLCCCRCQRSGRLVLEMFPVCLVGSRAPLSFSAAS